MGEFNPEAFVAETEKKYGVKVEPSPTPAPSPQKTPDAVFDPEAFVSETQGEPGWLEKQAGGFQYGLATPLVAPVVAGIRTAGEGFEPPEPDEGLFKQVSTIPRRFYQTWKEKLEEERSRPRGLIGTIAGSTMPQSLVGKGFQGAAQLGKQLVTSLTRYTPEAGARLGAAVAGGAYGALEADVAGDDLKDSLWKTSLGFSLGMLGEAGAQKVGGAFDKAAAALRNTRFGRALQRQVTRASEMQAAKTLPPGETDLVQMNKALYEMNRVLKSVDETQAVEAATKGAAKETKQAIGVLDKALDTRYGQQKLLWMADKAKTMVDALSKKISDHYEAVVTPLLKKFGNQRIKTDDIRKEFISKLRNLNLVNRGGGPKTELSELGSPIISSSERARLWAALEQLSGSTTLKQLHVFRQTLGQLVSKSENASPRMYGLIKWLDGRVIQRQAEAVPQIAEANAAYATGKALIENIEKRIETSDAALRLFESMKRPTSAAKERSLMQLADQTKEGRSLMGEVNKFLRQRAGAQETKKAAEKHLKMLEGPSGTKKVAADLSLAPKKLADAIRQKRSDLKKVAKELGLDSGNIDTLKKLQSQLMSEVEGSQPASLLLNLNEPNKTALRNLLIKINPRMVDEIIDYQSAMELLGREKAGSLYEWIVGAAERAATRAMFRNAESKFASRTVRTMTPLSVIGTTSQEGVLGAISSKNDRVPLGGAL